MIGQADVIKRSTNSGASWTSAFEPDAIDMTRQGLGIDFSTTGTASTRNGVAVGTGLFLAHSTDSGASWSQLSPLSGMPDLSAVSFVPDEDVVYVTGASGYVIRSDDGGANWDRASVDTSANLLGVSFADEDTGFVVGAGPVVFRTENAGRNWEEISFTSPAPTEFRDVETWGDGNAAVIVGTEGAVYSRTTGQFVRQDLGNMAVTEALNDVEELGDGAYLRIGGSMGTILFRDSNTWSKPKSQTSDTLYRMSFPTSASRGFGIGQQFVVLRYD